MNRKRLWFGRMAAAGTVAVVSIMAAMALPGCSKLADFALGDAENSAPYDDRPFIENEVAEQMALYYSGELTAPQNLYQTIAYDLQEIAARVGMVDPPIVIPEFRTPWASGEVMVMVDTTECAAMQRGEYHAWDSLNEAVGFTGARYYDVVQSGRRMTVLSFDRRYHPVHVATMYEELPGIESGYPAWYAGDWPNTYLRQEDGARVYYFRRAWMDCPSGCIGNEWWVVRVTWSTPEFITHRSADTGYGEWESMFRDVQDEYTALGRMPE